MIGASSGKIVINGVNIQQNMDEVHGYLSVCPQHNLQFTDLTVLEHLMFFGMVKSTVYFKTILLIEKNSS